jgi:hypothetical protein
MVIVRCPKCYATPMFRGRTYPTVAEPVGYPNPAIICCVAGCGEPGLVWLRGTNAIDYRSGQRHCFSLGEPQTAKVLVKPYVPNVP